MQKSRVPSDGMEGQNNHNAVTYLVKRLLSTHKAYERRCEEKKRGSISL